MRKKIIKLAVVLDEIETLSVKKDTSIAMLATAQKRNYEIYYMTLHDLFFDAAVQSENENNVTTNSEPKQQSWAMARVVVLNLNEQPWYKLGKVQKMALNQFDVILFRKDPPVNIAYLYATYLLEHAERQGVLVVNKPQSLRDCNEKFFTTTFPTLMPKTLVTSDPLHIHNFHARYQDIIIKPLDAMGGSSVFRVSQDRRNLAVICDILTDNGRQFCMAQQFLPEIANGDKRVLLINGEPIPYALARLPAPGEIRGNLAAGGMARVQPLSDQDWHIANCVGPIVKQRGLLFVGLDIIGNYLTEVNVTSPTGVRQIEAWAIEQQVAAPAFIMEAFFEAIETQLSYSRK